MNPSSEREAFEAWCLEYHEHLPKWTGSRYRDDVWEDIWAGWQARAALSHPSPQWLPIESAPKDGRDILLTNGVDVSQGQWIIRPPYIREVRDLDGRYIDQDESDGYEGWIDFVGGMLPEPTLWQPLPIPPEQGSQP